MNGAIEMQASPSNHEQLKKRGNKPFDRFLFHSLEDWQHVKPFNFARILTQKKTFVCIGFITSMVFNDQIFH